MKNKIKNICGMIIGVIFGLSLPIMLISYFTYTEKIVLPILLVIVTLCSLPLVHDFISDFQTK